MIRYLSSSEILWTENMAEDPYHHGDLRSAILDAAEKLLLEKPIEVISMRELARAAGVSPGAPYHHFKDRSGLILALCQRGFQRLGERLNEGRDKDGLQGMIAGYISFSTDYPAIYRLMFSAEATLGDRKDELHPYARPVADLLFNQITMNNAKGMTRGQELAGVSVWCFMHGLVTLGMAAPLKARLGDTSMQEFSEEVVGRLLGSSDP